MTQTSSASSKQSTTAICRLETAFLTFDGMNDHREGFGEVQNVEDEESELVEDEAEDEDPLDGNSNFEMMLRCGVASSLGDLSMNGSFGGVLSRRAIVRSKMPMTGEELGLAVAIDQLPSRTAISKQNDRCLIVQAGTAS